MASCAKSRQGVRRNTKKTAILVGLMIRLPRARCRPANDVARASRPRSRRHPACARERDAPATAGGTPALRRGHQPARVLHADGLLRCLIQARFLASLEMTGYSQNREAFRFLPTPPPPPRTRARRQCPILWHKSQFTGALRSLWQFTQLTIDTSFSCQS